VVPAEAGVRDLAAFGRDLQHTAPTLRPQVRQHRAHHLDRADDVGVDLMADLRIGQLLGRTEEPVAGVVHDHVNAAHAGDGVVDHAAHRVDVGEVQRRDMQAVTVQLAQVVQQFHPACGGDHMVAAVQQLFGHPNGRSRTRCR
jgi:hypothetical protein